MDKAADDEAQFLAQAHNQLPLPGLHAVVIAKIFALSIRAIHSLRSETSGSTLVARRAGIQQATSDTSNNTAAMPANVSGSVGRTPNNKVSIHRSEEHTS